MIVIFDLATGAMVQDNVAALPEDFDVETFGWYEQPGRYPDDLGWSADLRGFIDARPAVLSPELVEAHLIATIKAQAETRKMAMLSEGPAKTAEYAEKKTEVIAAARLAAGGNKPLEQLLAELPDDELGLVFTNAVEDAAAHGDGPADAIARFRHGIMRSRRKASIGGIEQAACAAVRAATTVLEKRRAYDAIEWP